MVSLSLGNLCLEQEGDKGLVLVRQESCAGRQRRCPPVCALLSRKKVTQKPFELEEEKWERNPLGPARVFSQREMLKVLRMEQSSPGLLSAHMSSSAAQTEEPPLRAVGCPRTARESPRTQRLK